MADEVGGKRAAAINLMFDSLLPKGYERESFAGMKAHELDAARIAELASFIGRGLEVSGVPGISVAVRQPHRTLELSFSPTGAGSCCA